MIFKQWRGRGKKVEKKNKWELVNMRIQVWKCTQMTNKFFPSSFLFPSFLFLYCHFQPFCCFWTSILKFLQSFLLLLQPKRKTNFKTIIIVSMREKKRGRERGPNRKRGKSAFLMFFFFFFDSETNRLTIVLFGCCVHFTISTISI